MVKKVIDVIGRKGRDLKKKKGEGRERERGERVV